MADDDKNTPPADDANAKQAQALLDALGPKLTEAILPAITEKVEEQIKGVVAKNSGLTEPDRVSGWHELAAEADRGRPVEGRRARPAQVSRGEKAGGGGWCRTAHRP